MLILCCSSSRTGLINAPHSKMAGLEPPWETLSWCSLKPEPFNQTQFYNGPMRSAFTLSVVVILGFSAFAQHPQSTREVPSLPSGHAASIPRDCNPPQLLANGQPIMIRTPNGLAFGVSLAQHEYQEGKPIELHTWVANQSDAPAGVFTCTDLERFRTTEIAIFAQDGHQVLTRDEEKARKECSTNPQAATQYGLWVCGRNILLRIPAHTCITRDDYDFESDLAGRYHLPPGQYAVRLQADWERGVNLCTHKLGEPSPPRPADLSFTVTNP
jgi:hypothetical protein